MILSIRSTSDEMIQPAMDAVKQIKFEPATLNGKPVTSLKLMSYNYSVF